MLLSKNYYTKVFLCAVVMRVAEIGLSAQFIGIKQWYIGELVSQ